MAAPPKKPLMRRDSQIALVGETQRFECQVVGFPTPAISWFKDGVDITHNPRYGIGYDPSRGVITLSIKDVSHDDEGCYQCRAENSEGYATTTAYLVVRVSHTARFQRDYQSMIVEKVSEEETTQVQMSRSARQTVIEEVITRVNETEQEIFEEKPIAPKITYDDEFRRPLGLKQGATIYIEVDIMGQPFPTVSWFHGERTLDDDARTTIETMDGFSVLKVKAVESRDTGFYKVLAENKVGKDQATFEVTVKTKPSPPRNVRIKEVYKDYITIEWDAPEYDGGEKIRGYQVEKSLAGGMFVSAGYAMDTCEMKVTKLYEGNEYLFQVLAENKIGLSAPARTAEPCKAKLPFDPPSAPRNFRVLETYKDYIVVSWEPPEHDGGAKVMQYIVEKRDATRGSGMFVIAGTIDASESQYKVTKLFQGNAYQFRVSAENRVGPGPPAEIVEPTVAKLPYDKPFPPRNLTAIETSSDYIVIRWEAPESDGGSPVTGYVVEKRDAKRPGFIFIADVAADTFTYKAIRLFEGYEYYFRVIAENIVGPSDPCDMERPVIAKLPYDEPDAPRNLHVTEYWTDFISLAWEAPENDGGSPITGYIIEKRDAMRTMWVKATTVGADMLNYKVTGLFEGGDYVFRVFAENLMGPSLKAAEIDKPVKAKMPFDPPFPPKNIHITDYNVDYITISWDHPDHDGGAPIQRYIIEKREALRTTWSAAGNVEPSVNSFKCDGLIEGDSYFFRVCAENQVGRGEYAETIDTQKAKLPFDRPGVPCDLRATDIWRDYIQIAWGSPEDDGGSPITGYSIEQRDALEPSFRFLASLDQSTTSFQATNLKEGHDYYYRVFAHNMAGPGEKPAQMREPVKAKLPFDKPSPPRNLICTGTGEGVISLAWEPVESDGGSPITAYIIEICLSTQTEYQQVGRTELTSTTYDITGLRPGGDYFVRVKAENLAGVSKAAEIMEIIRAKAAVKPPAPPSNVSVTDIKGRSVSLVWDQPISDGGSPISSFIIQSQRLDEPGRPFEDIGLVDSKTFTFTARALTEGAPYLFGVRSENMAGLSERAQLVNEPVVPKSPVEKPSGPRNVRVSDVKSETLVLEWDVPQTTGGTDIIAYIIEMSVSGGDWTEVRRTDGYSLSTFLDDLMEDTIYLFQVTAVNAVGNSEPSGLGLSASGVRTKPKKKKTVKPTSPRNVVVSDITRTSAKITWEAPESTGGTDLTAYTVEIQEGDGAYRLARTVESSLTTVTIETLKAGKTYNIRVYSENIVGRCDNPGQLAQPFSTEPGDTEPSAPEGLNVDSVTTDSITISWSAPTSTGGKKIKRYVVYIKEVTETKYRKVTKVKSETTTVTLDSLKEGTEYLIQVFAENEIGVSKQPAELSAPVKVPTAPKEEPKVNGVEPVEEPVQPETKPKEEAKPKPVEEPIAPVKEPEVKEAPKPVTKAPSAPKNLVVQQATESTITVVWEQPDEDGGSPIKQYTVSVKEESKKKYKQVGEVDATVTTFTITELKEDKSYEVRVQAINEVGVSEKSAELAAPVKMPKKEVKETVTEQVVEEVQAVTETKPKAPSAPKNLEVQEATESGVTIQWQTPDEDGGAPIKQFTVSVKEEGKKKYKQVGTVDATVTEFKILELKEDKTYEVRVQAVNEVGTSEKAAELKEPFKVPTRTVTVQEETVQEVQAVSSSQASVSEEVQETTQEAKVTVVKSQPPAAPKNLEVHSATEEGVTIKWESPDEDGGAPIKQYTVSVKEENKKKFKQIGQVDATVTEFKITELKEETAYEVRVQAVNEVGVSETAAQLREPIKVPTRVETVKEETVEEVTSVTSSEAMVTQEVTEKLQEATVTEVKVQAPAAPKNLAVQSATEEGVTITWESPDEDGGAPIKQYTVSVKEENKKKFKQIGEVDATVTEFKITELKEEKLYEVRVQAVNEAGVSEKSAELRQPIKVPTRVETMKEETVEEVTEIASTQATVTEQVQQKVEEAEVTEVKVLAPSAPKNLAVQEATESGVTVQWQKPDEDGGAPVEQYTVSVKEENKKEFTQVGTVDATMTSFTIRELQEETSYEVQVQAVNKAGVSKEAAVLQEPIKVPTREVNVTEETVQEVSEVATSEAMITEEVTQKTQEATVTEVKINAPSAPKNLAVQEATESGVTIQWEQPEEDGGAPVKEYMVSVKEESKKKFKKIGTVSATETSFTITELQEDKAYEVQVVAVNEAGPSEKAATLQEPIKVPTRTMEVTEETVQEVSEVATSEAMITEEVTQKTQEATVTEVKINAPSAPKNLAVQEATEAGVTIQWEQPEEDGGAPVKEYTVSVKEESKKKFKQIATVSATETSFTITELQEDKAYEVQVLAVNEAGPSKKAATLKEPIKVPTRTETVTEETVQEVTEVSTSEASITKETVQETQQATVSEVKIHAPSAPKNLEVQEATESGVTIQWEKPDEDGGAPIQQYTVSVKEESKKKYKQVATVDATETTCTIKELKPDKSYEVKVQAVNEAGVSEMAAQLQQPVKLMKEEVTETVSETAEMSESTTVSSTSTSEVVTQEVIEEKSTVSEKSSVSETVEVSESTTVEETPKKPVKEPVEEPKDEPDAAAPAQTAPEFTSAPQPVAIKEGETLKLSCKLKGGAGTKVVWYKDNTEVTQDERTHIIQNVEEGLFVLEVVQTTTDDTGSYRITATNERGMAEYCVSVSITTVIMEMSATQVTKTTVQESTEITSEGTETVVKKVEKQITEVKETSSSSEESSSEESSSEEESEAEEKIAPVKKEPEKVEAPKKPKEVEQTESIVTEEVHVSSSEQIMKTEVEETVQSMSTTEEVTGETTEVTEVQKEVKQEAKVITKKVSETESESSSEVESSTAEESQEEIVMAKPVADKPVEAKPESEEEKTVPVTKEPEKAEAPKKPTEVEKTESIVTEEVHVSSSEQIMKTEMEETTTVQSMSTTEEVVVTGETTEVTEVKEAVKQEAKVITKKVSETESESSSEEESSTAEESQEEIVKAKPVADKPVEAKPEPEEEKTVPVTKEPEKVEAPKKPTEVEKTESIVTEEVHVSSSEQIMKTEMEETTTVQSMSTTEEVVVTGETTEVTKVKEAVKQEAKVITKKVSETESESSSEEESSIEEESQEEIVTAKPVAEKPVEAKPEKSEVIEAEVKEVIAEKTEEVKETLVTEKVKEKIVTEEVTEKGAVEELKQETVTEVVKEEVVTEEVKEDVTEETQEHVVTEEVKETVMVEQDKKTVVETIEEKQVEKRVEEAPKKVEEVPKEVTESSEPESSSSEEETTEEEAPVKKDVPVEEVPHKPEPVVEEQAPKPEPVVEEPKKPEPVEEEVPKVEKPVEEKAPVPVPEEKKAPEPVSSSPESSSEEESSEIESAEEIVKKSEVTVAETTEEITESQDVPKDKTETTVVESTSVTETSVTQTQEKTVVEEKDKPVEDIPKPEVTQVSKTEKVTSETSVEQQSTEMFEETTVIKQSTTMEETMQSLTESQQTMETQVVETSTVEVREAPQFISAPEPVVAKEGETIRISCKLEGVTSSDVQWYKEDQPLLPKADDRITFDNQDSLYSVAIDNTNPDLDSGLYKVVATNQRGMAQMSVSVNIASEETSVGGKTTVEELASESQVPEQSIVSPEETFSQSAPMTESLLKEEMLIEKEIPKPEQFPEEQVMQETVSFEETYSKKEITRPDDVLEEKSSLITVTEKTDISVSGDNQSSITEQFRDDTLEEKPEDQSLKPAVVEEKSHEIAAKPEVVTTEIKEEHKPEHDFPTKEEVVEPAEIKEEIPTKGERVETTESKEEHKPVQDILTQEEEVKTMEIEEEHELVQGISTIEEVLATAEMKEEHRPTQEILTQEEVVETAEIKKELKTAQDILTTEEVVETTETKEEHMPIQATATKVEVVKTTEIQEESKPAVDIPTQEEVVETTKIKEEMKAMQDIATKEEEVKTREVKEEPKPIEDIPTKEEVVETTKIEEPKPVEDITTKEEVVETAEVKEPKPVAKIPTKEEVVEPTEINDEAKPVEDIPTKQEVVESAEIEEEPKPVAEIPTKKEVVETTKIEEPKPAQDIHTKEEIKEKLNTMETTTDITEEHKQDIITKEEIVESAGEIKEDQPLQEIPTKQEEVETTKIRGERKPVQDTITKDEEQVTTSASSSTSEIILTETQEKLVTQTTKSDVTPSDLDEIRKETKLTVGDIEDIPTDGTVSETVVMEKSVAGEEQVVQETITAMAESQETFRTSVEEISRVDIQEAPTFVSTPQPVIAKEGETLKISCNIADASYSCPGVTPSDVSWYKEERLLRPEEHGRLTMETQGSEYSIIISNAKASEDSGQYRVMAVNQCGFSEMSVSVEIITELSTVVQETAIETSKKYVKEVSTTKIVEDKTDSEESTEETSTSSSSESESEADSVINVPEEPAKDESIPSEPKVVFPDDSETQEQATTKQTHKMRIESVYDSQGEEEVCAQPDVELPDSEEDDVICSKDDLQTSVSIEEQVTEVTTDMKETSVVESVTTETITSEVITETAESQKEITRIDSDLITDTDVTEEDTTIRSSSFLSSGDESDSMVKVKEVRQKRTIKKNGRPSEKVPLSSSSDESSDESSSRRKGRKMAKPQEEKTTEKVEIIFLLPDGPVRVAPDALQTSVPNLMLREGEALKLECETKGETQTIMWFRNDVQLKPEDDKRVKIKTKDKKYTLEIKKSTPKDSGDYRIEAVNASGTTVCHVTVTVEETTVTSETTVQEVTQETTVEESKTKKETKMTEEVTVEEVKSETVVEEKTVPKEPVKEPQEEIPVVEKPKEEAPAPAPEKPKEEAPAPAPEKPKEEAPAPAPEKPKEEAPAPAPEKPKEEAPAPAPEEVQEPVAEAPQEKPQEEMPVTEKPVEKAPAPAPEEVVVPEDKPKVEDKPKPEPEEIAPEKTKPVEAPKPEKVKEEVVETTETEETESSTEESESSTTEESTAEITEVAETVSKEIVETTKEEVAKKPSVTEVVTEEVSEMVESSATSTQQTTTETVSETVEAAVTQEIKEAVSETSEVTEVKEKPVEKVKTTVEEASVAETSEVVDTAPKTEQVETIEEQTIQSQETVTQETTSVTQEVTESTQEVRVKKKSKKRTSKTATEIVENGEITVTETKVTEEKTTELIPAFKSQPQPTTVSEGEKLRLQCEVAGEEVEVKWYKDGKKLKTKKGKDLKMEKDETQELYFLEITTTTVEDAGKYTVKATNKHGTTSYDVTVTVEKTVTKTAPKLSEIPKEVHVIEMETLVMTITINGEPEPEVTWLKDGAPVKMDDGRVTVTKDSKTGKYTFKMTKMTAADAGEYSVTAINSEGKVFHAFQVAVDAKPVVEEPVAQEKAPEVEKAPAPEDEVDKAVIEKLADKIAEEKEKLKDKEEEPLFKEYPLLGDHHDDTRDVTLIKGEIVQVMDMAKEDEWLCRKKEETEIVCYVPVELLLGKKEKKKKKKKEKVPLPEEKIEPKVEKPVEKAPEPESEDEDVLADTGEEQEKIYHIKTAVTDYEPTDEEKDALPLVEGEKVEVLDTSNPDRWLCRLFEEPDKQGWVPPSYLMEKVEEKMSTQETFREEVLKTKDKTQQATMRRRYTMSDLWESERDYIRELKFTLDTYQKAFDGDIPKELVGKKDYVFCTMPEIYKFHNEKLLDELMATKNTAASVGQAFLNHGDYFQSYVKYYIEIVGIDYLVSLDGPAKHFKSVLKGTAKERRNSQDHDVKIGNVGESKLNFQQYLTRPIERIQEYIKLLQDIMRYSAQAGEDTGPSKDAIEMLMSLRRQAEEQMNLSNIVGYPGDLSSLGPIIRHEDFIVWEGEPTDKGKDRHMFLFKDKLIITRRKTPKSEDLFPRYEFKAEINLSDTQLNEYLPNDRRFELWYPDIKKDKFVFQAKTVPIKKAWCDELRRLLLQYGIEEEETADFRHKLKDVNCIEEHEVRFAVTTSGFPRPTVTWFKDNKEITEADGYLFESEGDRHVLILPKVTLPMAGKYKVKATNRGGSSESEAKLDVEELGVAPQFESKMEDVQAVEGHETRFEVRISGKPKPEVKWVFKDKELATGKQYKILVEEDKYTLIIHDTKMADDGTYRCKVKNKAGECVTKAKLIVTEDVKVATFDKRIEDQEVPRKGTAEFVAKISGKPAPKVTWYFKKKQIIETDRIVFLHRGDEYKLQLNDVMKADEGMYTCKATNELGESNCSANFYIKEEEFSDEEMSLAYAPSITKRLIDQDVLLGADVRFEIKSIGEPRPAAKWYHDGQLISEADERYFISRAANIYTLVVNNVLDEDAGEYKCELTNKAGKASSTGELIIERPVQRRRSSMDRATEMPEAPIMPIDKPTLTDLTEDTFVLNWQPAIYPPHAKQLPIRYVIMRRDLPSTEWKRVYGDITSTKFDIVGYDCNRDYMYRVMAENDFGISEPTGALSIYARSMRRRRRSLSVDKFEDRPKDKLPPRPPRDKPNIYDVTSESVNLSWQPAEVPSYGEQTEITYILERRCPPRKDWIDVSTDIKGVSYRMTGYKPEKDYMFRVRAVNKYGISDPSMTSTLFSAPPDDKPAAAKKKDDEDDKPKVKPRTIWDKPDIQDVTDSSLTLRWKSSSCPSYARQLKIWYMVEQRQPPNVEWTRIAKEVEIPEFKVTKFDRKHDYYWRIRAANDVGMSEPSMPAMLRRKDDWELEDADAKRKKRSRSTDDGLGHRHVPAHLRIVPEFLGTLEDVQYGVEGMTSKVVTRVRSYPEPKISWYRRGEKLALGDRFNVLLTVTGELTLEIADFSWADCGEFKIHIENQFGKAAIAYKMDMADPPTFLEPMKDQVFHLRRDGKLECRVHGVPYPKVAFKHDWRVIADSHRIKIVREDFDHWTLNFRNAIYMDEGMYECTAENVAGKVYCKANVRITEKSGVPRDTSFKNVPIEDYFHVIDELGRGACGVVRRVIDKNTGNQYACKFLRFADQAMKEELALESEIMVDLYHPNIVQVIDGYEDKKRLGIVIEIVTGGELLQRLVKENTLTESEVAYYLRQMLLAVEHMHSKNVIHLDLKPENIFMTTNSSDEIKIIDFGFARRYNPSRQFRAKYATPEFCAPEVANDEYVTPASDVWSIGVIAYILLSGISPFYHESSKETLNKVKEGAYEFDKDAFANTSDEAKDFIRKLLTKDPKKRISASTALEHPFIQLAFHRGLGDRIPLERLRGYMFRRKWQRGVNSVKTFAAPKPLSAYAVEVPDLQQDLEVEVPIMGDTGSEGDRRSLRSGRGASSDRSSTLEYGAAGMLQVMGPPSDTASVFGSSNASEWGKEYEDEDTWYEWSSAYQVGPETNLLPSKDIGLGVRMAKYRRNVGGTTTTTTTSTTRISRVGGRLRERRDLRDVEKDEDLPTPKESKSKRSVWQLRNLAEAGTGEGFPPVFKRKIRDKAYNVGDSCSLKVHIIANPPASVSWYRNDELLTDGGRIRTSHGEDGHFMLTVLSTKPHDFGVYKCVARNKYGKVTCRARMLCGDHPDRPGRPHVTKVSDREVYMIWEEPETDGHSYILAYRVDWHKPGDERWTTAIYCIDECALVKGLQPETKYRFRVCAINKFGISPYSWASVEIKTRPKNSAPIDIDSETKKILLRSRQATSRPSPDPSPVSSRRSSLDELTDLELQADKKEEEFAGFLDREVHLQEVDPKKFLQFGSEVWRGRFTLVRNVKPKEGKKVRRVAKVIPYKDASKEDDLREYEMLKSMRQEHIIRMYEAYLYRDFCVLVLEKLYGENVARSLSLKNKYTEHHITKIMKQVLDAMQFLHHRGIVHLNLQPDNVIMVSRRRFDVKLVDFGRARKVSSYEGEKVDRLGTAEFMAPEKVNKHRVGVAADIWGVGVLAFILLSGSSPFRGETDEDTYANIIHVRYDAHQIYHNVTKYALKFIFRTLKRDPVARLTTEEALDDKWLMLNAPMIKARKAAIFATDRLRLFEEDYIQRRLEGSAPSEALIQTYGATGADGFSSDEEELFPKE